MGYGIRHIYIKAYVISQLSYADAYVSWEKDLFDTGYCFQKVIPCVSVLNGNNTTINSFNKKS